MRTSRTLTVFAAGAALAVVATPAFAGPVDPEANNPDYWEVDGTTCTKYELTDGIAEWVLPDLEEGAAYDSIVLKAGRDNTVVYAPDAGIAYLPENLKDISHVIVCIGEDLGGDENLDDGTGDDGTGDDGTGDDGGFTFG